MKKVTTINHPKLSRITLARLKRSYQTEVMGSKRAGARGFHEGIFDEGFGGFTTLKKRRPEMNSKGMHSDAFTGQSLRSRSTELRWLFLVLCTVFNPKKFYFMMKRI